MADVGSKSQEAGCTNELVASFLITSLNPMLLFTVKPPSFIVLAESKAAAIYCPANSPA
jgi:hypothetical protein